VINLVNGSAEELAAVFFFLFDSRWENADPEMSKIRSTQVRSFFMMLD
jgi:hypothetical protein